MTDCSSCESECEARDASRDQSKVKEKVLLHVIGRVQELKEDAIVIASSYGFSCAGRRNTIVGMDGVGGERPSASERVL